MKKNTKTKTRRKGPSVAASAAKKKTGRLSRAKPRLGVTSGAVVLRLTTQQVRLLTGYGARAVEYFAQPYHVYRPPPGCGGGSPTQPWVIWLREDWELDPENQELE